MAIDEAVLDPGPPPSPDAMIPSEEEPVTPPEEPLAVEASPPLELWPVAPAWPPLLEPHAEAAIARTPRQRLDSMGSIF
jgi:hypothetical protein